MKRCVSIAVSTRIYIRKSNRETWMENRVCTFFFRLLISFILIELKFFTPNFADIGETLLEANAHPKQPLVAAAGSQLQHLLVPGRWGL